MDPKESKYADDGMADAKYAEGKAEGKQDKDEGWKQEMERLGIPLTDEASRFSTGGGGCLAAEASGLPRWTRARRLANVPIEDGHEVKHFECIQSESSCAYCLVKTLSVAIYGKVKQAALVEDRGGGRYVANLAKMCAIKVISKAILQRGELAEDPRAEVATMQELAHAAGDRSGSEFVCHVIEALEDTKYYYVVMPFCNGGELFKQVELNGRLPVQEVRRYMRQVLRGVSSDDLILVYSPLAYFRIEFYSP